VAGDDRRQTDSGWWWGFRMKIDTNLTRAFTHCANQSANASTGTGTCLPVHRMTRASTSTGTHSPVHRMAWGHMHTAPTWESLNESKCENEYRCAFTCAHNGMGLHTYRPDTTRESQQTRHEIASIHLAYAVSPLYHTSALPAHLDMIHRSQHTDHSPLCVGVWVCHRCRISRYTRLVFVHTAAPSCAPKATSSIPIQLSLGSPATLLQYSAVQLRWVGTHYLPAYPAGRVWARGWTRGYSCGLWLAACARGGDGWVECAHAMLGIVGTVSIVSMMSSGSEQGE
jgi:hypothetical protein